MINVYDKYNFGYVPYFNSNKENKPQNTNSTIEKSKTLLTQIQSKRKLENKTATKIERKVKKIKTEPLQKRALSKNKKVKTPTAKKPNRARAEKANEAGISHENLGHYDKALNMYTKAIKSDSTFPVPYYNSGRILESKQMINDSIEAYEKGAELRDGPCAFNAAVMYLTHFNSPLLAEEYFKIAIESNDPSVGSAVVELAKIYMKDKNYEKLNEIMEKLRAFAEMPNLSEKEELKQALTASEISAAVILTNLFKYRSN